MSMVIGEKYKWRHDPQVLIYLGHNWSGNGYWHQFERAGEPGKVWCEVTSRELSSIVPAIAQAMPAAQGERG